MTVFFVMPEHNYDSYVDYVQLIKLAGYPIINPHEMDVSNHEHTYIASWFAAQYFTYPEARARLIFWDLEWIEPGFTFPGMAEKWSSDAMHARRANARYVPLGSDSRLLPGKLFGLPVAWDVTLQMWRHPHRRAVMINRLHNAGLSIAPDGFGDFRNEVLQASRMLIHIHQHEGIATIAPQRFAFASAYKLPLLSESIDEMGIFKDAVLTAPYAELDKIARYWLRPGNAYLLNEYAARLNELLCVDFTFTKCVEAAL